MSAVRVLASVQAASVEAADEAIKRRLEICRRVQAEEEGCLQYEVFRSVDRPECFVLLELWSSKALYDKHWKLQQERERANPPPPPRTASAPRGVIEMYRQAIFQRVDGVWQSADPDERMDTIRWT